MVAMLLEVVEDAGPVAAGRTLTLTPAIHNYTGSTHHLSHVTTVSAKTKSAMDISWISDCTTVKSSRRCWQTQTVMNLYVCIVLETLLQLFNNFQCHTQIDLWYQQGLPLLTSRRASPLFSWYSLRLPMKGWPGWVDLGGWVHIEMNVPHQELNSDMVAHPSTNRARRRLTPLIKTNAPPLRHDVL